MFAKGYSLIELMVVLAIVGVIASIAYPSYQGYMRDTYQAQAVADLQVCTTRLERFYSNAFTYVGADAADVCTEWSPADQPFGARRFDMSFETETRNSYTIRMTPVGEGCWVEVSSDGSQNNEADC